MTPAPPPCSVPQVDEASLEREVRQGGGPLLVHLARWACQECPSASALREALARCGWPARCRCLDARQGPGLATRYQVTQFPTILLFRGGRVVHRLVGAPLPDELEMVVRLVVGADGSGRP